MPNNKIADIQTIHQNMRFYFISNMLRNVRGIIGDLGDTIVSGRPMVRALQESFQDVMGLHVCEKAIYKGFGMPKHDQIRDIIEPFYKVTPELIRAVHTQFEHRLMEHYEKHGVEYLPDTETAIKQFATNGVRFGCTTGLSWKLIHYMYPHFPLWRPSPILHCQRPNPGGIYEMLDIWNKGVQPNDRICISQCIKVGDSMSDLHEARAANVRFVGVTGHRQDGKRVTQQMKQAGAYIVVHTLNDVLHVK